MTTKGFSCTPDGNLFFDGLPIGTIEQYEHNPLEFVARGHVVETREPEWHKRKRLYTSIASGSKETISVDEYLDIADSVEFDAFQRMLNEDDFDRLVEAKNRNDYRTISKYVSLPPKLKALLDDYEGEVCTCGHTRRSHFSQGPCATGACSTNKDPFSAQRMDESKCLQFTKVAGSDD